MSFNCFVIEIHLLVSVATAASVSAQAGIRQRQLHLGAWLGWFFFFFASDFSSLVRAGNKELGVLSQARKGLGLECREDGDGQFLGPSAKM